MPLLSTTGAAGARAFGLFGQQSVAAFIMASGGTVTDSGNYRYHTFTASDTFSVSSAPSSRTIDYLLVAGGGAAGMQSGGGGGGVVIRTGEVISTGSYSIVIGDGAGNFGTNPTGQDTTGFGRTALGGGSGGDSFTYVGKSGGSGGGGEFQPGVGPGAGGAGLQPSSSSGGYGNSGGASSVGGGGGGAGGAASGQTGGIGISGSPLSTAIYASGGNGYINGVDAVANTGQGGGAGASNTAGASGIVIVRYLYQ